jgi:phosphoserine aminotransferase
MKMHIFNAGPCKLPEVVLRDTADAVLNLNDSGLSILEVSHRGMEFMPIIHEAQKLLMELLDIPEEFSVLFLGGGASMQFAMVPYNFLNNKAAYLDTGYWSRKAIKEAELFGEVVIAASCEYSNYTAVPNYYKIPKSADYFHVTTNNTIEGTEILEDIDSPVPLIADMSSDILTRRVDVSKYALIYGGAQKNMGPAGVAFVIVKRDALKKVKRVVPSMLNYKVHVEDDSLYNTPPCFAVYAVRETLKWVKEQGGVAEMEKRAKQRADVLYEAIDSSKIFTGMAQKDSLSRMNICFALKDEYKNREADFIRHTSDRGIVGLQGHRAVGGFRASCYNALELESVYFLTYTMKEFENMILK